MDPSYKKYMMLSSITTADWARPGQQWFSWYDNWILDSHVKRAAWSGVIGFIIVATE